MSQPDTLATRYGTPSPGRRRVVVVAAVALAAVFLGWLAWTAFFHATPAARSELVAYTIDGEHAASARVSVTLSDDDVVASCLLRARSEDHTVVGELAFEVTGDDLASGSTLEREVRTERRATSVELIGCTAEGQPRPQ